MKGKTAKPGVMGSAEVGRRVENGRTWGYRKCQTFGTWLKALPIKFFCRVRGKNGGKRVLGVGFKYLWDLAKSSAHSNLGYGTWFHPGLNVQESYQKWGKKRVNGK